MKKKVEIGILAIIFASLIFSLVYTLLTEYTVGLKYYLGIISIVLTIFLRLKYLKLSNYLLGLILIAGTFNLVEFSHIGFSIQIYGISFNIFILVFFILYYVVNDDEIDELFSGEIFKKEDKLNIK